MFFKTNIDLNIKQKLDKFLQYCCDSEINTIILELQLKLILQFLPPGHWDILTTYWFSSIKQANLLENKYLNTNFDMLEKLFDFELVLLWFILNFYSHNSMYFFKNANIYIVRFRLWHKSDITNGFAPVLIKLIIVY